ncbi:MAG TPA: hypothetical protein DIV79_08505 [Opitutae bacterium]|nr:hypothetical protein [Opitutae bacterium]
MQELSVKPLKKAFANIGPQIAFLVFIIVQATPSGTLFPSLTGRSGERLLLSLLSGNVFNKALPRLQHRSSFLLRKWMSLFCRSIKSLWLLVKRKILEV